MSRMKDWMMDMENYTAMAIWDHQFSTLEDIVAYVNTYLPVVDETYIAKICEEILGD